MGVIGIEEIFLKVKNMEKAKVIKRFEGGIKLRSVQLLERYVAHIKKAGRSR